MVAAVVTVALVAAGAVFLLWGFPTRTEFGSCRRGFGTECTDVPLPTMARVTGMDFPEGTLVEEASYSAFQDWSLEATLVVPASGAAAWRASLEEYRAQPAAPCTGLTGRGTDRRCGEADGMDPVRRYTAVTRVDGAVVVLITAFTV